MYCNGQTLKHKETNELARLDPEPEYGSTHISDSRWAWNIGNNTAFISKDGTKFVGNINDYICVKDELGRPYAQPPLDGQFVDESAERYLVNDKEMAEMCQKRLEEWEKRLLKRMKYGGPKQRYKTVNNIKTMIYTSGGSDIAGKYVLCPFADGGHSVLFEKFFLERRRATPLYRTWDSIKKKYVNGPMVFRHTDNQIWMHNNMCHSLAVIRNVEVEFCDRDDLWNHVRGDFFPH